MTIKNLIKTLLIALPFTWLASHILLLLNNLEWGVWLVETLSVQGYWPVTIAFYLEDFFIALILGLPYVALVLWLIPHNHYATMITSVLAYALFTFLLCFQKEHLTACLFTLLQSSNITMYLAIVLLFELLSRWLPFSQRLNSRNI